MFELLDYRVAENSDGSLCFDTEEEAEYPFEFCLAYAKSIKAAIREWSLFSIPPSLSLRSKWVEDMLLNNATKLLACKDIADDVLPTLIDLLTMVWSPVQNPNTCTSSYEWGISEAQMWSWPLKLSLTPPDK